MSKRSCAATLMVLSCALAFETPARATPPEMDSVRVLPVDSSADPAPGMLRVAIVADDLMELDLVSTISTAGHTLSVRQFGTSIAARASTRAVPAGAIRADKGDIVGLPAIHPLSLPLGAYAEEIVFMIVRAARPPFNVTAFRYFEVTSNGTSAITETQYAERTEQRTTLPDGTPGLIAVPIPGTARGIAGEPIGFDSPAPARVVAGSRAP